MFRISKSKRNIDDPCPSHVTPEWKSVGQRWCVKVSRGVRCERFKSDNRNICTFGGNLVQSVKGIIVTQTSYILRCDGLTLCVYMGVTWEEIWEEIWGFQILCHNNTWDICMVMDECINATLHAPSTATLHHCTIHFFITLLPQMLRK